jgi:LDH2 family malate/lactate/ureidoglycolate dehydrogenase
MNRFPQSQLEELVCQLAQRAGVTAQDATLFASALVDADLHDVSTHGVSRLGIYLSRIEKGLIVPRAQLTVERQTGGTLVLDAGNGLGQVQAQKALELLLPMAKQNGIAAATIRNSQHFGALSYYCNRAAEQGCILLAMTNGEPAMSPEGAAQAFFGTNPIAASFPTGLGFNIKIDLATSKVARGNIIAAQRKNMPIPTDWALDPDGEPTTDPGQALLGTVLTLAGHKGYALALMVELFSGVLSGAAVGPAVGSMYKDLDRKQDVGHFFCLMHIDAFLPFSEFIARVDEMVKKIKTCRRRRGVEEVLLPGERSSRAARLNRKLGVPVSSETLAELEHLCLRLGLPFPLEPVAR